ncbi:MAG: tetraacyldisaccharide 4'-kinase [SAR324 cluster bacterium]|nr:tetraacyldisaccharide 4'-kinase [SAR324 cluster bacterium]
MNRSSLLNLKLSWKTAPLYFLLLTISLIYEAIVLLRLVFYQKGVLRKKSLKTPIISVGNLTVGGSGKTPMVDFLAKELLLQNKSCAILSRGYGNQTQSSVQRMLMSESIPIGPSRLGDEPYFLASRNPTVPVYVGKNRTLSGVFAQLWDSPQIFILDDGYQHIQLNRALNLLLIDADRGFGSGYLLPLGELREPEHHWQRADAVILTKCNLGFSDRLMHRLQSQLNITCPIFKFGYVPHRLRRLDHQKQLPLKILNQKKVLLNCGIANPDSFAAVLKQSKAEVLEILHLDDHLIYSKEKVAALLQQTRKWRPDYWVTTEKDAVKLRNFSELEKKMWVLEMRVVPDPKWQEFFVDFLKRVEVK